jgi:hypothetical protein
MLCFLHCCLKTLMCNRETSESSITKTLEHKYYCYLISTPITYYISNLNIYITRNSIFSFGKVAHYIWHVPIHKFHQQPLPPNITTAKIHQEKLNKPLFCSHREINHTTNFRYIVTLQKTNINTQDH